MSSKVFGHRFKNFRLHGSGGFGVLAHELIRSYHTARIKGYRFGFIRNGLAYPELFGNRNWLDYFQGEIVETCDVEWPNVLVEPTESTSFEGTRREWYRKLARELMILRPEIQKEIDEMISQTGFQSSECVMHVRRTDKVSESTLNDLQDYVEAVVRHVPLGTRIFLLTDDPAIRTDMQERMRQRGYPLVWDEEDTTIHCQRIGNDSYLGDKNVPKGPGSSARGILGKFSEDQLQREIMTAIKLITMMSRAQYLIGARISMLFRIGEILSDQSTFSLRDFSYVGINDFFWPYIDPNPKPKPKLEPKVKRKVFGHRFKNFRMQGGGGFGAIAHELICSYHTSKVYGLQFGFLRDGLAYPELFGNRNWLDFFEGKIVETCDIEWPKLIAKSSELPSFEGTRRDWYRQIAREIFVLHSEIRREINEMVSRTGFQTSDCVCHVRRTDKISESSLVGLEDYANAIVKNVPRGTRIFLLSDDPTIRVEMQQLMGERGYSLVWDEEDTTIHCERIGNDSYLGKKDVPRGLGSQARGIIGKFSDDELRRETMTAIKLITMMSGAQYLIGARMSMLFRIGELLSFQNPSNIVSLSDLNEPGKINWPAFYVESSSNKFSGFGDFRKVILPDFLNGSVSQLVKTSLQQFRWWQTISGLNYQRSDPKSSHYSTCNCCLCSLKGNLEEKSFQRRLEQLSGKIFAGYQDICLIRVEAGGSILEQFSENLLLLSLSDDDGGQLMTAGSATRIASKFGQLILIQNPTIFRIEPVQNQLLFLRAGVLLH